MKLLYFSALFCSVSFAFVLAQNDPKCGTNGPAQLKIIGGVEATPYEWPWTVSLGVNHSASTLLREENYQPMCGGSIIHRQFVLTSAKCAKEASAYNESDPYLIFAAHNVSAGAAEPRKITQLLGEVIAHPDYSYDEKTGNRLNDIALIKLREPLDIENNPDLGLICVPDQNDDYNPYQGQMATVVGWGLTSNQLYTSSKVLLKVSLPVNSMDECVEMYDLPEESKNSMICTYQVGASPCMLDDGGPLMLQDEDGKWMVVGTASYFQGKDCGEVKHPYMYAHVSIFSDWIWDTVKENE